MKNLFKYILTFLIFLSCALHVSAAPVIKITGLTFDNSDSIVILNSIGKIHLKNGENMEESSFNTIKKGYLTNPNRIYVDIENAILSGQSQTIVVNNSKLENIKLSQFSKNPNTVRLVFTYSKNMNKNDFKILANDRQIAFLYGKSLVASNKFTTVYNNMTQGERRADIYEPVSFQTEIKEAVSANNSLVLPNEITGQNLINKDNVTYKTKLISPYETKLKSLYFLNNVTPSSKGIMLKGLGNVSLKSSFELTNPNRVVFDIENAVLAQNLRNKSFTFSNGAEVIENGQISQREILRLGQNSKNIARLVVQGNNAKDYRIVVSPDLQSLFVAKRQDILNSKLTQTTSDLVSATASTAGKNLLVLNLSFSSPIALCVFEENSKFYLDIENMENIPKEIIDKISAKDAIEGLSVQKIASEKTRFIFKFKNSTAINAQISPDAKELRIYFKERIVEAPPEKMPTVTVPAVKEDKKIKPSVIKPVYTIVLDAGHGGSDVGATREGIYEKNINLAVVKELDKILKKRGIYTHLIRQTDKTVELNERSDFSNNIAPDAFVSIHVNSSVRDDIIGLETHWYKDDSLELAKCVHNSFASKKNIEKWETKDRGLFRSKFYVINHTEAPAILVEIGFISNPFERSLLITEKRQEEIAKSIADGIWEYLKTKK